MLLIFYLYISIVCVSCGNACEQHQTCRECIRDPGPCVWCSVNDFNGTRCISEVSASLDWCADQQNPPSMQSEIPLEKLNSASEIIQLKPQSIKMKLRLGQPMLFNFSYKPAEDYPVDLYFLYEASMGIGLRDTAVEQTKQVIPWLRKMTKNAAVGFGTFVDKNVLPFTRQKDEKQYSFKHQFSLTEDHEAFIKALERAEFKQKSRFDDFPNGGFDALAQVLACDVVGWQNTSRKIVVFISDSSFHAAGDGRQAGINNPFDGGCYMKNELYTNEHIMDYPSISMINNLAANREVTIIFVIDTMTSTYQPLERVINGVRVIHHLVNVAHTATISSELKQAYENITQTINLKVNMSSTYKDKISLTFTPDGNNLTVYQNTEQTFVGKINVTKYFKAEDIKVYVSVRGLKEKLALDIEILDDCNCPVTNDNTQCNGKGIKRCGICECQSSWSGKNCECSSTSNVTMDTTPCIMPNSTIECSGRGSCICSSCVCGEKRYKNRYCECDNESCPRDDKGRLCGNGECQCGECVCDPGWDKNSQRICVCDASTDRCQTGASVCSNYGDCKCNECKCPATNCGWDSRSSLSSNCNALPCQDCHGRQCHLLEAYALNRIKLNSPCEKRINITLVEKLENNSLWMNCSDIRVDVGCYTNFAYRYDDESYGVHVIVQSKEDCAESAYIYGGACLGALLLIGILTLLGWKALTTHRYRKEYKMFIEQHKESLGASIPVENILYNSPNQTVKNPNFRRRSIFS